MKPTPSIRELFEQTRSRTEVLCQPLEKEDFVVQPVEYVSPPKWHLGHTSWFFEEFILKKRVANYREFDRQYGYVFNSYYESFGKRVVRTDRGNLSRPTVDQIMDYRAHITHAILNLLASDDDPELRELVELGIHHEMQHQELLITDVKFILGHNPLLPVYNPDYKEDADQLSQKDDYITIEEGIYEIGHANPQEFHYDNERGRHKVYLNAFSICRELVTNTQYLDFISDGGYRDPLIWHSEGWEWKSNNKIAFPLYWHQIDGTWYRYTLQGLLPLEPAAPVTHISYYEAAAYAQWRGMRLPTEFEWEVAASRLHCGSRWEWTESAYLPYPGYQKAPGALGEYNGKFMVNQKVLRGGSIATPDHHLRPTYRNFFHPHLRWQFTGFRLIQ